MKRVMIALLGLVALAIAVVVVSSSARDELHWRWASHQDKDTEYAHYLALWPGGRHTSEAKSLYDERSWTMAQTVDTATSYQQYIDAHPAGRFVAEARSKRAALLQDDAPYLALQKQGSRQAYETFLMQFPGHKREAEARAALKDMEGTDLADLLEQKKVEVKTRGSGIEHVGLEIRRLAPYEIAVLIPVGTFFVSRRASVQNMVTTKEQTVMLNSDAWVSASIAAACANRPRDIPGGEDSFSVQRSPNRKELEKLMPILRRANASSAVQQAAVWIVTDDADYYDLGTLVESSGLIAFGGSRVINESEAALAMKICDEAGINITKKAIWRNRNEIIQGLQDESLKRWIQQRGGK